MGILIGLAIAIIIIFSVFWYKQGTSTNKLRILLAARNWKAANNETERLITLNTARIVRGEIALQDSFRKLLNYFGISYGMASKLKLTYSHRLSREEMNQIPCNILHEIDQLWVQYSNGHFGFSIQLDILEECQKADDWKKKEVQEFDRNSSGYGIQCAMVQSYFQGSSYFASLADPVEVVMLWERLGWITRGYTPDGRYTYLGRRRPPYELNYSLSAPKGQLPVYDNLDATLYDLYTLSILQRLKDCGHSVTSIPEAPSPSLQSPFFNPNSQPLSPDQPPSLDQPPGPDYPFL
ncbi:GUN4 domain-containing protein [Microcoleus sp. Pol10D4]|uniref:GUN4 domain-containing protein n=1 Tax=Microcoleus sp. Pol10D4 TaxID=3055387 RepID=UPI002FD6D3AB